MTQYSQIKSKYPDAILLFRVGDFYETFGEDAVQVVHILGTVLINYDNGGYYVELDGSLIHSLHVDLHWGNRAGLRVAICEHPEKPSKKKVIVRGGVTELVTTEIML